VTLTARERTAFRKQVTAIIESCMTVAGWSCLPFRRSMKLFARPGDVTPFLLLSNIAGRRWGGYVIEGGIGILHRPFERHWSAIAKDADNGGELTAFLHSANIREINELAYIDPHQPIETQVYLWCEPTIAVLNALPTTELELSLAYRDKRLLAGHPLDHFLLSTQAEKKAAFQQFLEGGPVGT
jgi:hypothetical protein